jgi:hypothetical protein
MCLQSSAVRPWDSWNWSGDEIVYSPIIPASRTIPGKKKRYPIDVREFLTTTNNAVVNRSLNELIRSLPADDASRFRSHARGSFDFRADKVSEFVGRLRYLGDANKVGRCPDAWLFPDETLAQGGGDCEDLALLLAALLMAAGISPYCVRVALGHLEIRLPDAGLQRHDHSWVVYQNEGGVWEIVEPLRVVAPGWTRSKSRSKRSASAGVEYVPHYVFNRDHLWLVRSHGFDPRREFPDYCLRRTFWDQFDPAFAAGVHSSIFDKALGDLVPAAALSRIKRKSLWLDANIFAYDPCDHFDNGYIDLGWAKVNQRLNAFKSDASDWESFGAAAHSIGDFYAHSSYLHFANLLNPADTDGSAAIYEDDVLMVANPGYDATPADPSLAAFDLTSGRFSVNGTLWKGTPQQAATHWSGAIVSGRYAQKYDPQATFWEGWTSLPAGLSSAPDFAARGSLPHHDEIAVDQENIGKRHKLYAPSDNGPMDRQGYANQFRWRVNTAIQHIRKAFIDAHGP